MRVTDSCPNCGFSVKALIFSARSRALDAFALSRVLSWSFSRLKCMYNSAALMYSRNAASKSWLSSALAAFVCIAYVTLSNLLQFQVIRAQTSASWIGEDLELLCIQVRPMLASRYASHSFRTSARGICTE